MSPLFSALNGMGDGKATANGLATGLTEVGLQRWCIRHRTPGTVNVPKSMAMPQRSCVACFRHGITDRFEQQLKQFDGQPRPRFAVGFARDGKSHQARNMIAGDIASEDLRQKGVHRRDWVKSSFAPRIIQLSTNTFDHFRRENPRDFRIDLRQYRPDKFSHPWPPRSWVSYNNPNFAGGRVSSKINRMTLPFTRISKQANPLRLS